MIKCPHIVVCIMVFALSFPAVSLGEQVPTEKRQLAGELVKLLEYDKLFENYLQQCEKTAGTYFDPDVAYKASPDSFGGLSPQSARWEEVRAIFRKYQNTVCKYLSAEEFSAFFEREYAELLSVEDLREAIAFQRSPAGQRIQQASVKINQHYLQFAQDILTKLHQDAYHQANQEVANLLLESEQEE